MQQCVLVLSDGNFFKGKAFGKHQEKGTIGEVVFNTSLSGYQEIITDPSYKGQFVCFTYPSIGNYGVNTQDSESVQPYLKGIIVRDYCDTPSNFRSQMTLHEYLVQENIPAISGIDTRALVRHIREQGAMNGGIFLLPHEQIGQAEEQTLIQNFVKQVQDIPTLEGQNLTNEFDGKQANIFVQQFIEQNNVEIKDFSKILVLDFGIKFSILKNFLQNKMLPIVVGGDTPREQWQQKNFSDIKGIFLSNGPGDPAAVSVGIENTKYLLSLSKPIFGICLGHQLLSLAKGAKTYKLKFGHHGGNQPVKASSLNKIDITAQNHGFAVDSQSLLETIFENPNQALEKDEKDLFFSNLNDQTFEGYILQDQKIISVQYHPEACPGPHDVQWLFNYFYKMLGT